jgi:hypothetical protein
MPDTELEWTFDDIPADSGEHASRGPQPPQARPPRRRRDATLIRRLAMPALLLAATGLGVYVYVMLRTGWDQVSAQIRAEVVYEDQQSLAGNAAAVRALQATGNAAWANRRASEAAAGFPSTLPGDDLLPAGSAPQVVDVQALEAGLMQATVVRRFANSNGQEFDFLYEQRYEGLGAGQWRRLPPDEQRLSETREWRGQRVAATFPAADWEWLAEALPKIDAYLTRACIDWQCGPEQGVNVQFVSRVSELLPVQPARRPERPAGSRTGYPATFDQPFTILGYPRRVLLPSPHLAGRPADDAASNALVRSITVSLLTYLGSDLAGTNRNSNTDYFDALVARAEIRLGLSPAPDWPIALENYVPAADLWHYARTGAGRGRRPDVVMRLQALYFLNFALDGRPQEAETSLLKSMRQLHAWGTMLSVSLGADGDDIIRSWTAQVTAGYASRGPVNWQSLDGLAFMCANGGGVVSGGDLLAIRRPARINWMPLRAVSPDGAFVALTMQPGINPRRFQVMDTARPDDPPAATDIGVPLGWTADNQLVYWQFDNTGFGRSGGYFLRLLDPGSDARVFLTDKPLALPWLDAPSWSDRLDAMALTTTAGTLLSRQQTQPAVLLFHTRPPQVVSLPATGYAASISPTGRVVAYAAGQPNWTGQPGNESVIVLYDLEAGQGQEVPLPLDAGPAGTQHDIVSIHWAPDGQALAVLTEHASAGTGLHVLSLDRLQAGGPFLTTLFESRFGITFAGFSADSRYLAAYPTRDPQEINTQGAIIDRLSGQRASFMTRNTPVWGPGAPLLAVPSAGGLTVLDAASDSYQWVAHGACTVSWNRVN